jgi:hypothetical protein
MRREAIHLCASITTRPTSGGISPLATFFVSASISSAFVSDRL